uniref:INO80 complex subunit E N-terminal domain-containing protein n=1 Tax=Anopheles dirus TaxID=7168 RepID=A0A182NUC5_9DIPT
MQSTSCVPAAAAAAAPAAAAEATAATDDVNAKYRNKYRQLKRYMKDLVFENAALCDHIAQVQEKISQRNEERRFMLKKLLDHENELETQLGRPCSKLNELIANSLPPKRQYKKREKPPATNGVATAAPGTPGDGQEARDDTQETTGRDDAAVPNGRTEEETTKAERHGEKNGTHRGVKKRGPASKSDATGGSKVRKKPRHGGTVPSGKKGRVPSIAFDPQSGHPTYPIVLGGFTVQQLGEIVPDRPAYHTESAIYPIGYTATRPYGHYKDPEKRCLYTCRVLDGGERPRFEIVPECADPSDETGDSKLPKSEQDEEDEEEDGPYVISGSTTDGCHAELLQRINATLNLRSIDSRPSGDWFFGLAHPTIAGLLQSFPGAKQCAQYRGSRKDTGASTSVDRENDPTLGYDALVRHITISAYRTVPEIKEEPPDELFDHSDGNSFSLSV